MAELIKQEELEKWANYLLDYSLGGLHEDDVVMIKGEHVTWPLMNVIQQKVFDSGAIADVFLVPPDNDRGKVWGAAMAKYGSVDQAERVPDWMVERYKNMTKYIEILGSEDPDQYKDLPDETLQAIMKADEPMKNIRLGKPWVLTLYPTQGFADMEDMSLEDYTRVVVNASMVDPRMLDDVEDDIYKQMAKSDTITIQSHCPNTDRDLELKMDISDKNIVKCTGKRNFPDGEVFTSPNYQTVEGEIFVDLPVSFGGSTIQGIYLKFEKGKIVKYKADKGNEYLTKIIETDKGSHHLGEVALGMNNGIEKVLKHPLFVEKVGGTLHIAIGASYPECYTDEPESEEGKKAVQEAHKKGILNKSAQHVDIVTDFREGGAGRAVYLDDVKLEIKDNIWVVPD